MAVYAKRPSWTSYPYKASLLKTLRALTLELGSPRPAPPRSYLFDHNRYIYRLRRRRQR
jgi:hypothetical protein